MRNKEKLPRMNETTFHIFRTLMSTLWIATRFYLLRELRAGDTSYYVYTIRFHSFFRYANSSLPG